MLEDWDRIIIVNCFEKKGDATEQGNYRGFKLLETIMKVFEQVIKQKI